MILVVFQKKRDQSFITKAIITLAGIWFVHWVPEFESKGENGMEINGMNILERQCWRFYFQQQKISLRKIRV